MPVISIFGSGKSQPDSWEYQMAITLGSMLSRAGYNVATGGYGGIMEAALKGCAESTGKRIGVTSSYFQNRKKNVFVDEEIVTTDYLDRLEELLRLGNAYVIFPGGTGTLLELAAILALKDRGMYSTKPLICVGKQWKDVLHAFGKYPDDILESFFFLKFADSPEEAFNIIDQMTE